MAPDLWYYSRAGQQFGPMPRLQLERLFAAGEVFPADFVWTAGMPEWSPAEQVFPPAGNLFAPPAPYSPGVALPYAYGYTQLLYAPFWQRFAAWFIDQVLLFAIASCVNLPVTFRYGWRMPSDPSLDELKMRTAYAMANMVLAWLYFAALESSPAQATLGKLLLGLRVTDLTGERVSFGQASARFFSKILSTLLLFLGFVMALFTQRRQALHDLIAGTVVVRKMEM